MDLFKINGQEYSQIEIKAWSAELLKTNTTEEWLKDIASFIQEWFDDSDHINLQTSGTTGSSKSYSVSKESMVNSARLTVDFFSLNRNKTALLCLPAKYIAGKMMIVRSFISGMNLIIQESTSSPLKKLQDQTIDFCPMIPLQVQNSLQDYPDSYNKIESVIIGGAPISFALEKKLIELTSNSYATFGMTETLSHIALKRISSEENSNFFKALNGVQFELENECLVIEAPHLFSGKLATTDLVELLDSTRFIWKGRKDLIINSGGIKINPEEIERQIANYIEVDFFISSIADDTLGRKLILILEDPNDKVNRQELMDILKSKLASHTAPKEVHSIAQFVRTPTGKVKRNKTALILGK